MPTTAPPSDAAAPRAEDDRAATVTVEQLDSIEQARLWHELGPVEATRTLVAALRAALLVAEVVEIDRNELFDGVFFLMTPPERLRWHLGLEPGAPLPLRVALLETPSAAVDEAALGSRNPVVAAAAWQTQQSRVWGVEPDDVAQIVANVDAVRASAFVSSAFIAMTGRRPGQGTEARTVLLGGTSPAWESSCDTVVVPGAVWATHDNRVAARIIDEGRDAWVRALLDGRLALGRRARMSLDMGSALDTWPVTDPAAAPYAQELVHLTTVPAADGSAPCARTHAGDTDAEGRPRACGRHHVVRRSEIVDLLDALDGPGEGAAAAQARTPLLAAADGTTRRLAFRWWNQAYRDAILAGTDASITIGVLPTQSDDAAQEIAWRLREPDAPRWETVGRRLGNAWCSAARRFRRAAPDAVAGTTSTRGSLGARLVVEGEVVDIVLDATPYDYARLHTSTRPFRTGTVGGGGRTDVAALALEVRDQGRAATSYPKRRREQTRRAFGAVAILGALLLLEVASSRWGLAAAAIGLLLSTPWGVFVELLRLTPGRLQATLRIREMT